MLNRTGGILLTAAGWILLAALCAAAVALAWRFWPASGLFVVAIGGFWLLIKGAEVASDRLAKKPGL